MTAGKAASQAGHAFLDAFLTAPIPDRLRYLDDGGTKIVLVVPDGDALCAIMHRAKVARLPCAMVVEQDHVMPPHFDGTPIPTAVGIGPVSRRDALDIVRGLPLLG